MSEKATLYFVITKVIAPKCSFFNLILSVDNSKTILKSPRSRSNAYTIPYKIMKEVSILDNKGQIYNIEIIFYDKDQPVINGSVNINIKDFFKASSIELKQYDLNVPNIDNISVFVGVALVPIGEPFLSDFDIYGNSAKIISKDDSNENQSTAQNSPVNDKLECEPEIVESESGKKHRRKKGTTDNECITFISQSGRSHKKHRIYSIPEHSPSFDQKVDDEEIIRSESGSPHRRKRGTKDTKAVTFISEGGHEHRKRRSRQSQTNEMENQQIENSSYETQNQNQQNENEIQNQQNEIQNQDQQNEDQNQQQHRRKRRSRSQQQQEKTENEVVEIEKERSSTDSKVENAVSEESSSRRRKRTSESQTTQQEEQQQEKTRKRRHRKTESEEKKEEKQKEEEEVTTNSTTENRRRRKRKEKSTTDDGETETSSTKTEKH